MAALYRLPLLRQNSAAFATSARPFGMNALAMPPLDEI
jgi:hypothetical protein